MSIFDKIAQTKQEFSHGQKLMSDAEFINYDSDVYTSAFEMSRSVNKQELLEANISWVYACVDAISNELANINFKLYKVAGNQDVSEVKSHDILDLLARANQHTTKFDLFYLSQTYLELTGEAPWLLRKETKNGPPTEIYLLRPDLISVKPATDPSKGMIGGYKYKVYEEGGGYTEVDLTPEEVLFLKYPDPLRPIRGRGTLQAVLRSFQMDSTAEEFNLKFFQNGATPSALLSVPKPLQIEARAKLERMIKQKYTTAGNAHKTIIVEGDMKYQNLATSQREMDYIQTMTQTRDKILAIFRVPRTALGITDDVNRANAEATDLVFAKRTIKPKMEKLTEMLNEFLVPLFDKTGTLFLDYEDPVPENLDQKLVLARDAANAGIITPNEAREILGFDPVDGGDELKVPSSPFGGFGVTPPAEPVEAQFKILKAKRGLKKMNINVERMRSSRKRNAKQRKTKEALQYAEKILGHSFAKIVDSQIKQQVQLKKERKNPLFKGTADEVKAQKYDFQNKQLRVVDEYEARTIRAMESIFKIQKQEMLDKIKDKGSISPEKIRLNEKEEAKRTHEQLEPIMNGVIREQSRESFALLGKAFKEFEEKRFIDNRTGAVAAFLQKRLFQMAKKITQETNDQLQNILSNAVSEGMSIPKASKEVAKLFDNFGYRSDRIARTEIIRASNFASEESFKESGVVEGKEWLATLDERTGDLDAALDGSVAKLGKDFHAGGESVPYPPLHPNCRCTIIPVIIS